MVLSSLFPNSKEPSAGLFIRERMHRFANMTDIFVVSPKPWSPFDPLIRLIKPDYRVAPIATEEALGMEIHFPRFFALPYVGRRFDAWFMGRAVAAYLKKHQLQSRFQHIDAHFTFPDGVAGAYLKTEFSKSLTITMRGTELPHSSHKSKADQMKKAWAAADKVISVSDSLRQHAIRLGTNADKTVVVGNGVETKRFFPILSHGLRERIGIPDDAKVMVTIGGLVDRKGFHRVIDALPKLSNDNIHYLIIGGATKEGDNSEQLKRQVEKLGLNNRVHFLGKKKPDELREYLSAADLFVLMSTNEGWANVILESMACGTPVLASNVGGNAEVVSKPSLGKIIELDDQQLIHALDEMFAKAWQAEELIEYANQNSWDSRIEHLSNIFIQINGS